MGQGLYDMLGWGVIDPPVLTITEADGTVWIDDALGDAVEHLGLRSAYETEPSYLVIPLAVSEEFLQERWALPDLPSWCPRVAARRARVIDGRKRVGRDLGRQRGVNCVTIWQEAQRIYAKAGLSLPDAMLVIASDWD